MTNCKKMKMAQMQLPAGEDSTLKAITQSCEKLINQTQADLELFKHEQNQLRDQILGILEENHRLDTKLEALKSSTTVPADSRDDATREKLTKEALKNVQQQIDYLQEENKELRLLNKTSQKTIQNLQHEIQTYRTQLFKPNSVEEIKQKYITTIKVLESSIKNQKTELFEQQQLIEKLFEQKRQLEENVTKLEETVKVREQEISNSSANNTTVENLQAELMDTQRQKKELEKSLKLSKRVIEERFEREKHALQKVQEALTIAEAAVADKEDAQKREQVVKEECDNLASTIGQVMEDAAQKVEKDMEAMKRKLADKEKVLLDRISKLNEDLLNQKKFNEIVETRCNRIEHKHKEVLKDKEKLSKELHLAMQTIGEMELKLEASENLIRANKEAQILAEKREKEIEQYIQNYKQSKHKYKLAIDDVTRKFEKEIYRLQTDNAKLKAENQVIKLQHNYPSD